MICLFKKKSTILLPSSTWFLYILAGRDTTDPKDCNQVSVNEKMMINIPLSVLIFNLTHVQTRLRFLRQFIQVTSRFCTLQGRHDAVREWLLWITAALHLLTDACV